jgi:mono/diheme cytochrome c family protein
MSARRSRSSCFLIVVTAVIAGAGCGATRRLPPLAPPPALSAQAATGQVAFMEKCNQCHPGGEAGLGPALNDKPFPSFLKQFQVRHGVGVMPHFSQEELSDAQLDAILEYLGAIRQNPRRASGRGSE